MEETKPLPKQKGRRGTGTVSLGGSVVSRYAGTVRSFEGGRSSVAPRGAKDSAMLQSSQDSSKAGETKAISKMPENMDELVKINKNTEKTYKVTNKAILQILKVLLQVEKLVAKSEKKKKKEPTTLERLMERLKKYSPENLLKTGKEKLKDKSVSLVNRGLDKMGVKARLDKLDERDKKLNIQRKKSGLDKTNIKSKSYIDRVPGKSPAETFASDKKSVVKMASDKSVLSRTMPNIVRSLGSSMGALIPIVLKVLLAVLVIAAAAGIGYMLYKLLIEPFLNKNEKTAQERLATPKTKGEDVYTDKGEKVYEKTIQGKNGAEKVYVTESQKQKELESMPEQEREAAGQNYVPARIVTDLASGKQTTTAPGGFQLKQGMSIDQLNAEFDAAKQKSSQKSDRVKALEKYDNELSLFEADFKKRLTRLIQEISEKGIVAGSTEQVGAASTITPELQSLSEQHSGLIDRIKGDSLLTEQDKKMLLDSRSVTQGGMENKPSYDNAVSYAYTLPNNKTISLQSAASNSLIKGGLYAAGLATGGAGFGLANLYDTYTRGSDTLSGLKTLQDATQPLDGGIGDKIKAIQEEEAKQIKTTPPTASTSADNLQQKSLDIRTAPIKESATTQQTQTSQKPIVINNNTTNASMSGGGGGAAQYATATPPESSSMEPALLGRDESRSASLGGNSS
jgi:hypothetical protein